MIFSGTIALGLSLHTGPLPDALEALVEEAQAGERAGFDGITLSEHHAGFPTYAPVPVTLCGMLLERLEHAFAIACPTLLGLRAPALLAEELAWQAALHPGRVGVGVASGYARSDFDFVGADFEGRNAHFRAALPRLVALLRGEDDADPALAACADAPLGVVAGVVGPVGAARAAAAGAGALVISPALLTKAREVFDAHEQAGGPPARVLIRQAAFGEANVDLDAMVARFRTAGGDIPWLGEDFPLVTDAEGLIEAVRATGATALNVRVHAPGLSHEDVLVQIEAAGPVLDAVRQALGWRS